MLPPVIFHKQPAVDGAEFQFAGFCPLLQLRVTIENPANLGAGKIRVDKQPGFFPKQGFQAVGLQLLTDTGTLAALPDNGAVDRLAGLLVPDHGGLALVGNTDGGQLTRLNAGADSASAMTFRLTCQISSGSCSTQPGCG